MRPHPQSRIASSVPAPSAAKAGQYCWPAIWLLRG
jgi:hypothetical protein